MVGSGESPSGGRVLSPGLTGTLRWFFYGAAAVSLGASVTTYREIEHFDAYVADRSSQALARLLEAEQASEGLLGVFSLVALVVAVLTIIWWYQAYQTVEDRAPLLEGRSWSAGWAIGGWFIPIANLIIPKLVLNEIDRASSSLDVGLPTWKEHRLAPASNWWWASWVFGSLSLSFGVSVIQAQLERGTFDAPIYRSGLWMLLTGLAVLTVAALCAAATIRVIGERLGK